MTTFYLIRHGSNDYFAHTLVGRTPGIHLNEAGRREALQLAERLAGEKIQKILSSPMERCRETAEPLAKKLGLKVELSEPLIEVNFGDWTGKKFADLEADERWRQWNSFRAGRRVPNGEAMIEVQARMVALITSLGREFPEGRIALFSHGEPLRGAMIYFLGAPADCIRRIDIGPASVSVLQLSEWEAVFRCLNARLAPEQRLL